MKIIGQGGSQTSVLPSGPGYLAALKAHFGIVLDAKYADLKPVNDSDSTGIEKN